MKNVFFNDEVLIAENIFLSSLGISSVLLMENAGANSAKIIFERESLLGCSITGFTNNPDILFNPEILEKGAQILKEINLLISNIIEINPAARIGCTKPSGNASVLLETASGIHGEHSEAEIITHPAIVMIAGYFLFKNANA